MAEETNYSKRPMEVDELRHHLEEHLKRVADLAASIARDGKPLSKQDRRLICSVLAGEWFSSMASQARFCFMEGEPEPMAEAFGRIITVLQQYA